MKIDTIIQYTTLISGILMVLLVLLQQRGAGLGAGFGASGELHTTRRGLEKNLFEATVIVALIFVMSIMAGLLLPR